MRFEIGRYDRARDLVIDPVLTFSSYFGGANSDAIYAVAADPGRECLCDWQDRLGRLSDDVSRSGHAGRR